MKKFLLVKLSDLSVIQNYDAEEATIYGGPWGDGSQHASLEVPEGIDYRTHDITEVTLAEGQVEADIDFDCKHSYSGHMGGSFVKYFKFVENAGLVTSVAAEDAAEAIRVAKEEKARKGQALKVLADKILHIIAGHNHDNGLDATQIAGLKTSHTEAFAALSDGMPYTAKSFIDDITPDGTLITQDELDHVALEYAEFAIANPSLVPA